MISSLWAVSLVELLVGLVCLAVAAVAWGHRDSPGGTPLFVLSLAATGWAVTAGVASLVVDPGLTRWAQLGTYAFVGPTAVSWFYVAVEYTGRTRWKRPAVLVVVAGLVAVEWVLLVTDPIHHLYIAEASVVDPAGAFDPTPGPLLWVGAAWKIGLVGLGTTILVGRVGAHQGLIRVQTLAVLVAGVLPVAASLLEVVDVVMVRGLDFGVVGVAASAAILLWALFYARFLDIVPVARETLMGSMTDPVVAIDAEGRVVDLNDAAKDVFGVGDEAIGSLVTRVVTGFTEGSPDEVSVRTGTGRAATEGDGERRHFEINVSPIPSPTGSSDDDQIGSLLVFRDVTLRRERERELENRNARLQEFTGVVSHDLRNPLSVAKGRLELGREEADSEHLAAVGTALDRMETLIDDLLALARKGRSVTETEPVALAGLVEECWGNVDTGEATLVVETDATVEADRGRLQELVENLLRNAVEHGGDAVTITVGDLARDRGFYVADDGRGIPAADRVRVLEIGYSTNEDGTGLGLVIVDEIARAHGWSMRIAESESGGARFEFVTE